MSYDFEEYVNARKAANRNLRLAHSGQNTFDQFSFLHPKSFTQQAAGETINTPTITEPNLDQPNILKSYTIENGANTVEFTKVAGELEYTCTGIWNDAVMKDPTATGTTGITIKVDDDDAVPVVISKVTGVDEAVFSNDIKCETGKFSANSVHIGDYIFSEIAGDMVITDPTPKMKLKDTDGAGALATGSYHFIDSNGVSQASMALLDQDLILFANAEIKVGTDLLPESTDDFTLGSDALRFISGFFSGAVYFANGTTYKVEADGDVVFKTIQAKENINLTTPNDANSAITLRKTTNDATHILWTMSHRSNNKDLIFYAYNAAAFFPFIKLDYDNKTIDLRDIVTLGDGGATDYAQFAADGELNLFGTARVIRSVVLPALIAGLGSSAPTKATVGNFGVLQFVTTAPPRNAHFTLHMPLDWATGTDLNIKVYWAPTGAGAGNVVFDIDYTITASEANELISGAGTNLTVTDATQTLADELLASPVFTIAGALLALEDTIGINFSRDTADAADTYAASISLVYLEVEYTADKLGEAT